MFHFSYLYFYSIFLLLLSIYFHQYSSHFYCQFIFILRVYEGLFSRQFGYQIKYLDLLVFYYTCNSVYFFSTICLFSIFFYRYKSHLSFFSIDHSFFLSVWQALTNFLWTKYLHSTELIIYFFLMDSSVGMKMKNMKYIYQKKKFLCIFFNNLKGKIRGIPKRRILTMWFFYLLHVHEQVLNVHFYFCVIFMGIINLSVLFDFELFPVCLSVTHSLTH